MSVALGPYWGKHEIDGQSPIMVYGTTPTWLRMVRDFMHPNAIEPEGRPLGGLEMEWIKRANSEFHARFPMKSISETYDLWKGRTFIIAGSGPSLAPDLPRLRELVEAGAVVVAFNRSYGLIGDCKVFFTLDRMIVPEYWRFRDKHRCTLITTPTAGFEVMQDQWKHIYHYRIPTEDRDLPLSKVGRFAHLDWLEVGFITLTTILHWCKKAGAAEVILCGCDSCVDVLEVEQNGKRFKMAGPYYTGCEPGTTQNARQLQMFTVLDTAGKEVLCDPFMLDTAQFINGVCYFAEKHGMPIYKSQDFGLIRCPVKNVCEVTR